MPLHGQRLTATGRRALAVLVPLLLMMALGASAWANAGDEGLNAALVPLENGSAEARIAAFPRALDQVFTKLSGSRPARYSQEREIELAQAALLVERYRYEKSASGQLSLWVRFDEQALAESMVRAGVEMWSRPRPSPLLWGALRSEGGAELLAPGSGDGLDRVLLGAAWRRGLPLRLPLMDLEDRMRVNPEGLRSADVAMLAAASERYPATGPVVGVSVEQSVDAGWAATWVMLGAGRQENWRSWGATPEQALEVGMDALTDRLVARRVAGTSTSSREVGAETTDSQASDSEGSASGRSGGLASERIDIAVLGIEFGGDYGRLMQYLRGLEGVSRFVMLANQGERARFRLDFPGGEEGFRRAIADGDVLEPDSAPFHYRLKH